MNSFYHLFNLLSPDSNTKGKQFEKITKWFLENAPKWQAKIEKVCFGTITQQGGAKTEV
jgi:hypothetical protein